MSPVQLGDVIPGVAPYLPAGHRVCIDEEDTIGWVRASTRNGDTDRAILPLLHRHNIVPNHKWRGRSAGAGERPWASCNSQRQLAVSPPTPSDKTKMPHRRDTCHQECMHAAQHVQMVQSRVYGVPGIGTCTRKTAEGTYAWLEFDPSGQKNPAVDAQHHTRTHTRFTYRRRLHMPTVRSVQWGTLGGQVSYLPCTAVFESHRCSSSHPGKEQCSCESHGSAPSCRRPVQPLWVPHCRRDRTRWHIAAYVLGWRRRVSVAIEPASAHPTRLASCKFKTTTSTSVVSTLTGPAQDIE